MDFVIFSHLALVSFILTSHDVGYFLAHFTMLKRLKRTLKGERPNPNLDIEWEDELLRSDTESPALKV